MVFTTIDKSLIPAIAAICRYRRPNLVYNSGTIVSMETGLDGTAGDGVIMFPDGDVRTETSSTRYNMTISQNAVFNNVTLGSNQGGLRTGSATNNTWYSMYAVKVTTFAANWVLVADTIVPVQANYATLNTNFGVNGWVYLGVLPYGQNDGTGNIFPVFNMCGNRITLRNSNGSSSENTTGVTLTVASTSVLAWAYAAGTSLSSGQVPAQLVFGSFVSDNQSSTAMFLSSASNKIFFLDDVSTLYVQCAMDKPLVDGFRVSTVGTGTTQLTIVLFSYIDGVLGVGSNPLL